MTRPCISLTVPTKAGSGDLNILPILTRKIVYPVRYARGIFNQHFTARERLLGEQKKDDSVHELWFWVETRIRRNLEASKENEKKKKKSEQ